MKIFLILAICVGAFSYGALYAVDLVRYQTPKVTFGTDRSCYLSEEEAKASWGSTADLVKKNYYKTYDYRRTNWVEGFKIKTKVDTLKVQTWETDKN